MLCEENSAELALVKNIVLIGSTGAGKSTTGNVLLTSSTEGPFQISDDEISCTFFADEQLSQERNLRVIDTPGFGDNRYSEKEVDKIIRDLTMILSDPRVESTAQIDAFILPVKFNPRPTTLKTDLEHFIDLFGTVSLKSLVMLFIIDKPGKSKEEVFKAFCMMTEIVRIIKEGKGEDPNENWFCLWDNLNPLPGQEEALFHKISKLEPYTHKKFVEADKEIKMRLDAKVQAEVERVIARIKRDYEDDKQAQAQKIMAIEEKFEIERQELMEARDRARNSTAQFIQAMEQMSNQNKAEMEQIYKQMRVEREENQKKALAMIQNMQEANSRQTQEIMKQNNEVMAKMQRQMTELANRKPQVQVVERVVEKRSGGGCNMF